MPTDHLFEKVDVVTSDVSEETFNQDARVVADGLKMVERMTKASGYQTNPFLKQRLPFVNQKLRQYLLLQTIRDGEAAKCALELLNIRFRTTLFAVNPVGYIATESAARLAIDALPQAIQDTESQFIQLQRLLDSQRPNISPVKQAVCNQWMAEQYMTSGLGEMKVAHMLADVWLNIVNIIHREVVTEPVKQSLQTFRNGVREFGTEWALYDDTRRRRLASMISGLSLFKQMIIDDTDLISPFDFTSFRPILYPLGEPVVKIIQRTPAEPNSPDNSSVTETPSTKTSTPRFSFTNGLKNLIFSQASACEIDPTARWGYSFDASLSAVSAKKEVELTSDELISVPAHMDTLMVPSGSEKETGYTYRGTAPRAPRPNTKEAFISSPTVFLQLDPQGIFVGGQFSIGPMDCKMGVGTDQETINNLYRRFIAGTKEISGDITDSYGRRYDCCIKPVPWTTKQVYVTLTELQENGRWYADPENHRKTIQCELKKIEILRHNNKGRLEAGYAELIGEFRQERFDRVLQQLSSDLDVLLAPQTYNPQAAKNAFSDAMQPYGDIEKCDKRDVLQQRILNAIEQDVTTLIGQINSVLALDTYNPQEADRLMTEAGNRYAGFDFFDAGEDGLKAQLQQWMLHGKETNDVATAVKAKHHYAAEVSAVINEYNPGDLAQQKTLAGSLRLFKSNAQALLRTEIERIRGVEQQLHEKASAIATHLHTERAAERSPTHNGADKLKEVTVELEHMHAAVTTYSTQLEEIRRAKEYQLQLQPLREERFNIQTVSLVTDAVFYVLNASCNNKDVSHHLQHFQTAMSAFVEIGLKGVSQQLEGGATHHFNDNISFMLSMRTIFISLFSSLTLHRENTVPAYLMPITNLISAIDEVVTPIAKTWQTASIETLLDIPHIKAGLLLADSTQGVDRFRYLMSYFLDHLKQYKQNPALLAAGWMNYFKRHAEVSSVWLERATGYQLSQYLPATPFYVSNWSILPLAVLSATDKFYFQPRETIGEAPETFLPMMAETMSHLASHPAEICVALLASQLIDAGLLFVGVPPITTYIVLPAVTGLVLGEAMDERTITAPLQNGLFYFDSGIKSGDLEALLKAEAKLVQVREVEAKLLKSHPRTQQLSQGLRDVAMGINDHIEPKLAAASVHARALQMLANDLHENLSEMMTCYSVSGVQAMRQALESDHSIHGPQRDKVLHDLQQVVSSADPMLQLPKQLNELKKQCVQLTRGIELSKRCLQLSPERINLLELHLGVIQRCIAELEKTLKSTDIEAFFRTLDELVKTDDFARLKPTEEQLSERLRYVKHKAVAECSANAAMAGLQYLFDAAKAVRVKKDLPLPNWPLPTTASQQGMFFSRKRELVLPQRQSTEMVNPFHKQPIKASMDFLKSTSSSNACTLLFKPSKIQPVLTHPGVCYATK